MLEGKLYTNPREMQAQARAMVRMWTDGEVQAREMIILLTRFIDYFRRSKSRDPTYIAVYRWLLEQFEQTPHGQAFFRRNPDALSLAMVYANGKQGGNNNGFTPPTNEQQQLGKIVTWLYNGGGQELKAAAYKEVLERLRDR